LRSLNEYTKAAERGLLRQSLFLALLGLFGVGQCKGVGRYVTDGEFHQLLFLEAIPNDVRLVAALLFDQFPLHRVEADRAGLDEAGLDHVCYHPSERVDLLGDEHNVAGQGRGFGHIPGDTNERNLVVMAPQDNRVLLVPRQVPSVLLYNVAVGIDVVGREGEVDQAVTTLRFLENSRKALEERYLFFQRSFVCRIVLEKLNELFARQI